MFDPPKILTESYSVHHMVFIMEAATKIATLRDKLNRLCHEYYVLGNASVNDADYDLLYRELQVLEKRYPELADPASPTRRVGYPVKGMATVKHAKPMLSLDNMYTPQEVFDFIGGGERVCLEPKIDGLSLKVVYKDGKFQQAITRGNGVDGEDATASAKTILSLPMVLNERISFEVVGEVYMTFSVFNALNERQEEAGEDLFANPRNAAVGSLKLKDPAQVAARKLSFVAYGVPTRISGLDSQAAVTHYLESLGFQTVYLLPRISGGGAQVVADSFLLGNAVDLAERIAQADVARKFLDLPTDGLVFKIDDLKKQRELGEGTKYPKHSCAFKFPPERKPTMLLNITLEVGRTGKITPVGELAPVQLSGTTVTSVNLCNAEEIERLGLNIGDEVNVEKSAEIIPKVMSVSAKKTKGVYSFPANCPCCGTKLVNPEGFVDWYCLNPKCEEQIFHKLEHAVSKGALDIDGCGEVLVRELMRHGVRTLSDLFAVKNLNFLTTVTRQRFEIGRDKAKRAPYWRKLHALGIETLGTVKCQTIASRWLDLETALDSVPGKDGKAPVEVLKAEIGEVSFKELCRWLEANIAEIDRLESLGFALNRGEGEAGPLVGKVFCITGNLMSGTRDAVVDRIIAAGGIFKTSVSKTVDFLVVGAEAGRTKTIAAEKHGTKTISEEELYSLMDVPMPLAKPVEEEY